MAKVLLGKNNKFVELTRHETQKNYALRQCIIITKIDDFIKEVEWIDNFEFQNFYSSKNIH